MNKYILQIILIVFIVGCSSSQNILEERPREFYNEYRNSKQNYLEDSSDVFWMSFPDPFSNSTFVDGSIFVVTQAINFKNYLKGVLSIDFVDSKTDSIICRFSQPSKEEEYFNESFWIWFAKPSANKKYFPKEYFLSKTENPINIVLVVNERRKTILQKRLIVPKDMYCFIKWTTSFKKRV